MMLDNVLQCLWWILNVQKIQVAVVVQVIVSDKMDKVDDRKKKPPKESARSDHSFWACDLSKVV